MRDLGVEWEPERWATGCENIAYEKNLASQKGWQKDKYWHKKRTGESPNPDLFRRKTI